MTERYLSYPEAMAVVFLVVLLLAIVFRLYFASLAATWHREKRKSQMQFMRDLERGDENGKCSE